MMKRLVTVLALFLAACGGNLRTTETARYDFGDLAGSGAPSRIPIAAVDVEAASWLSGPTMHFRLAYVEPLRRQSYADSVWAAPPAELLEAFLKRRMVFGQPDTSSAGCRLQLVVVELEQRFDDPQRSQLVLDVRALLTPSRSTEILSRRAFLIRRPAATPDARAGAAAAREAAQALVEDLGGWLDELSGAKPAIVERCRT